MTRKDGHGGIDFDFSGVDGQLFAPPGFWRLVLFVKRAVHDRSIDSSKYTTLIENSDAYRELIDSELQRLFTKQ
jgi:hypothetical protein